GRNGHMSSAVYTSLRVLFSIFFFFSSRRRHTSSKRDWSSDVCSSDLRDDGGHPLPDVVAARGPRCPRLIGARHRLKANVPNQISVAGTASMSSSQTVSPPDEVTKKMIHMIAANRKLSSLIVPTSVAIGCMAKRTTKVMTARTASSRKSQRIGTSTHFYNRSCLKQ